MLLEADLPDDVDALRALVLEQAHELDLLKVFRAENERLQVGLIMIDLNGFKTSERYLRSSGRGSAAHYRQQSTDSGFG